MWASRCQDLPQKKSNQVLLNWYPLVCKLHWFEQVPQYFPMDSTFVPLKRNRVLRILSMFQKISIYHCASQNAIAAKCRPDSVFGSDVAQLLLVQFAVLVWEGDHRHRSKWLVRKTFHKKNVSLFNSIGYIYIYISETSILVFTDLKMYSIFLLRWYGHGNILMFYFDLPVCWPFHPKNLGVQLANPKRTPWTMEGWGQPHVKSSELTR